MNIHIENNVGFESVLEIETEHNFVFNERSRYFEKKPAHNRIFLQMQRNWATDQLRAQGHLFLNEILDMLGMARTPMGAITGWLANDIDGNLYDCFTAEEDEDEESEHYGEIFVKIITSGVIFHKI